MSGWKAPCEVWADRVEAVLRPVLLCGETSLPQSLSQPPPHGQALLNGQDSKYIETGHIERLEIGVNPVIFPPALIVCGDFYLVNTSSQLSSSISPIKITSLFYGFLSHFNNLLSGFYVFLHRRLVFSFILEML